MEHVNTIEELRADIFEQVQVISNRDTLLQILAFLQSEPKHEDWWDDVTPAQRKGIQTGLEDLRAGRRKSHAEVMKKYGM